LFFNIVVNYLALTDGASWFNEATIAASPQALLPTVPAVVKIAFHPIPYGRELLRRKVKTTSKQKRGESLIRSLPLQNLTPH